MLIGPFDLKHIVISVAIIIVTTVAMYMLKQPLSFGITIGLWLLVTIAISIVAILALLIVTIMGFFRYGKEGFLFARARKEGLPVIIDAELGSDNADFVLGEKESPKDVIFKDEESGVKIDPSLLSSDARPLRFTMGLDVYIYCFYNFMPQSIRNHAAFKAIEDYFRMNCKELSFLSIKEFSELISDPEHFLEHNATIKLNKYFKQKVKRETIRDELGNIIEVRDVLDKDKKPVMIHVRQYDEVDPKTGEIKTIEEDITLSHMIELIAKARSDISILPVMGGYIAGTEAFKNNSVAYSSQHFSHALMLYLKKINDEWMRKLDYTTIGYAALMICGGITIILAIIFVLAPGGGK